jgi:hypothetical protein
MSLKKITVQIHFFKLYEIIKKSFIIHYRHSEKYMESNHKAFLKRPLVFSEIF